MANPCRMLTEFWRTYIVIVIPLAFSPLIWMYDSKEARCGYVIIIMGFFWMTEVVPMAMTSLIPVFGFPLLGVMTTDDVCYVYMKETNMMFLGGLMIAIAVEHCHLHKRIALAVILRLGQSPMQLMGGFMVTTMFLSMWISNTASTAMMVPIVDAILQEFYKTFGAEHLPNEQPNDKDKYLRDSSSNSSNDSELSDRGDSNAQPILRESPKEEKIVIEATSLTATPPNEKCKAFRDMFFLATAYGANLGGTGTYTGSGTNLVMKGFMRSLFEEESNLNFSSWMIFNIPGMLISGILVFMWLRFHFIGFGKSSKLTQISAETEKSIKRIIQKKYDDLGSMTFHEYAVLTAFVSLVLLWLFLSPGFIPGWMVLFQKLFGPEVSIGDATPAMLLIFILFCVPARPNFLWFRDPNASKHPSSSPGCLSWKVVQEKIPWGIILLMGGGFAMAKASQESGLSLLIGERIQVFKFMSPEVLLLCTCVITAMATEITSNAATASILLPVLKDLSLALCVNPLFLMLPATLCCSFAFMLPVATPPNAIVYGAANIDLKVMMKAGFVPNVICVIVVLTMINTYGIPVLGVNTVPAWANSSTNGILPHC